MRFQNKTSRNIKRLFTISLITLSTCLVSSCKEERNEQYIDNAIAIVYDKSTPYLINEQKQLVSLGYYDHVEDRFSDYISVGKNGLYGFINNRGEEVIPLTYQKVYPMKEEKAVVFRGNDQIIINSEGKEIYDIADKYDAIGSFSENHLIIRQDDLYGFIKYDETSSSFSVIEPCYDYLANFYNNYAIVGSYDTEIVYVVDENGNNTEEIASVSKLENLKYNFLTKDYELLFPDTSFDFVDYFYEGYARVANKKEYLAKIVGNTGSKQLFTNMYKYINEEGKYLKFNYRYTHTYLSGGTLVSENKQVTDEIEFPYAANFSDGFGVVAKYVYSTKVQTYLKEYMIINTLGKMDYVDAIYYETSYKYGYDSDKNFQSQSPSQFWIGKTFNIGGILTFNIGKTLSTSGWYVKYAGYDFETKRFDFRNAEYELMNIEQDEEGNDISIPPKWMQDFNKNYLDGAKSYSIASTSASIPYELDDFKYSPYYNNNLVAKTRISMSQKCGLITAFAVDTIDEFTGNETKIIKVKYIIDPIYDKIIY